MSCSLALGNLTIKLNRDEKYIEPQHYHIDECGNLIFHLSMHEKNKMTTLLNLKNYSFKQIINVVCRSLHVQKEALIGNSLSRNIVEARIIVAYYQDLTLCCVLSRSDPVLRVLYFDILRLKM